MYYWDNLLNFAQLKFIKMVAFSDITYCISDELVKFHETFEQMLHTKIPLADNIIRYFLDRQGRAMLKLKEGDTHHGGCGFCGGDK